jgi:uncharacterized membrane protein YfcA
MPTIDTLLAGGQLLWLLAFASLFVGLSKGGLPAVGMLSVPILSLSMSPVLAAVLLLPIYVLSDVVGVWLYRRDFSGDNLKILIPAGFAGVLVGWATAAYVSDQMVSLVIGVLGIGFCLNTWNNNFFRRAVVITPAVVNLRKGLFWGTLSGFTSFVSHAGAPPYQIYVLPQKLPKLVFAGTTTILFAAVNLAKLVPYATLHPYSADTLKVSAALLPVAAIGTVVGRNLITRLSEKWFFLGVQIALFAISWKLVLNAF